MQAFKLFDTDGDGVINHEEILALISKVRSVIIQKLCAESFMDEKLERNIKGIANFLAHLEREL